MSHFSDDVETIAAVGGYDDTDDVLEDAVRELLRRRPELRTSLAIEKYRAGDVSLNRAAELADMSTERLKDELTDRGIDRSAGFLDPADRERELDEFSG
ncbi:UPF0175 family protein [Halostagnicola sp. A-GB9-2]|uniref:UPF0175 family protein n=1 Tax=Halostagnicola sp. A-GB9-2 TaxID=3048066 RepID=UPI0024BFF9E8|nr:UPF0175 family protein [Halostagnicola sp. A-GB9-2]MDJ1434231.1 UPF0175 family protein [Halostagnicola sp. A-GB9-2]